MKNTTRALRRHHRTRMISRALRKYREWELKDKWVLKSALRNHSHMASCSCDMCCNTRRNPWLKEYDKMTFQEKRNLLRFEEEMEGWQSGNAADC